MPARLPAVWWAAAAFGLLVLVIAGAFFGPAAPLQTRMTQRFLEAEGRSPEQLAARAAEERRAEEERRAALAVEQRRAEQERLAAERRAAEARQQEQARREAEQRRMEAERLAAERQAAEARQREQAQREAEQRRAAEEEARRRAQQEAEARQRREQEERQRAPARLAELSEEWRTLTRRYRPAITDIRGFTWQGQEALRRNAGPQGQVPQRYTVDRACFDPPPATERDRNIADCAHYIALNRSRSDLDARDRLMIALYWRVFVRGSADDLPLPDLIAYAWIEMLTEALQNGDYPSPPTMPPLMLGGAVNRGLILLMREEFARRLLETATPRELETLRARVYPDIARMHEIVFEVNRACYLLQRRVCMPVDRL